MLLEASARYGCDNNNTAEIAINVICSLKLELFAGVICGAELRRNNSSFFNQVTTIVADTLAVAV